MGEVFPLDNRTLENTNLSGMGESRELSHERKRKENVGTPFYLSFAQCAEIQLFN